MVLPLIGYAAVAAASALGASLVNDATKNPDVVINADSVDTLDSKKLVKYAVVLAGGIFIYKNFLKKKRR